MNDDSETQIVWRLSKADKGRYVAASRLDGKPLIAWLKALADAASDPITNDQGQGGRGDLARERPQLDSGGGRPPGDVA